MTVPASESVFLAEEQQYLQGLQLQRQQQLQEHQAENEIQRQTLKLEQVSPLLPTQALLPLTSFLPLAPASSSSFPAPKMRPDSTGKIDQRSASVGSEDAKSPAGLRFLKLGPVYYGEHPEDLQCDFVEVAVD